MMWITVIFEKESYGTTLYPTCEDKETLPYLDDNT